MKLSYVKRHSVFTMLEHWCIALSGLALFVTAAFMRGNEAVTRVHLSLGLVFTAAVLVHIIRNTAGGHFGALMRKGDISESVKIVKAMFTGSPEPASGKFLAEQRVTYTVVGIVCLALIVTGFAAVSAHGASAGEAAAAGPGLALGLHGLFAMLFFLAFLAHMAAFVFPVNRPLFRSMFTGAVRRDYAEKRHSLWALSGRREMGAADLSAKGERA